MSQFEHNANDPQFADKFSRLQQKILSLELSLQEAGKNGLVGPAENTRRAGQLRFVKTCLDQLMLLLCNQRTDGGSNESGLPDLSRCTYHELTIINHMQNERLRFIKEAYFYLGKIFRWAISSSRGKGIGFAGILRLSRMKGILQRLQHENVKMDLDDKSLTDNTRALSKILKDKPHGERQQENFSAYMKLFQEVDNTSVRIQKMKNAIARETRELTVLQDEIAALEKKTSDCRTMSMPAFGHVKQLAELARDKTYRPVRGTHDKLTLARRFVEAREKSCENELPKRAARHKAGAPTDRGDRP